jgi:hypothetical protein
MSRNVSSKFGYRVPRSGVTFNGMYKGGLFKDEPLFDSHGNHAGDIIEGRLILKSTGVYFSSFTAAARFHDASVPYSFSVVRNGFKYWHVLRGGTMVSIFDVKEFACRKLEEQIESACLDLLNVSSKKTV